MENLKQQTQKSIVWSIIDKVGFQVVTFLVAVITMKMIATDDFGLIQALVIITILSSIFVDSGFTAALVRRQNNTNRQYTAVFYFNLAIAIVLYLLFTLLLPTISKYFKQPELIDLGKFLFLSIIINALCIIPNILLVKSLNFKQISLSNLISAAVSAIVVIWLALLGFGYWALAWQLILQSTVKVIIMWFFSKWKPSTKPEFKVIKELFAFSSILLLTSTVSACTKYIYTMIIGRLYSMSDLGQYGRADKFQQIISGIVSGALSSVAYPIFAQLNNEKERQLLYFRKITRIAAFLIFPMTFGLIGTAENFMFCVSKESEWLPAAPFLQILAISAMFVPFQSLCSQMLNAIGKPKWNFYLEMFRNLLIITSLAICIISVKLTFQPFSFNITFFENNNSISLFLIGFSAATFLAYLTNILVIGRFIKYSLSNHLKDILPYFAISAVMCALVFFTSKLTLNTYLVFVIQCVVGAVFYLGVTALLGSQVLKDAVNILKGRN